ncbi:protein of unknown function DUF1501 [Chthoniobacter flavus Ellin428]|uniref:Sulfatase n=1 Tax=Chthoniobacter flavus Ellin428 TaxID=497964 RepID=B4D8S1_9BACT|nr:DUF1501 domain-containing protein [Chthoniobacter flavus]EDY17129.1 protein of unknown function DUF1501 [Chthoniobacter flavus Ellin428]TCO90211.1 uncharacterized protein DUF1501 [Chthoniobacter flavus]
MSEIKPVTWFDDPSHFRKTSRREFLFAGLVGSLGLTLGDYFKLRAEEAATVDGLVPQAESLIHIFLPGGCAHQETWDPHPYAPIEYRGPLGTVDTKIPGVKFSQYLQETAKIADKITVVRSMTHGDAAHERGTHNMFTGYKPSPALLFPSMGSVVSHELGSRNNLPPYVCVPNMPNEYAGTGYLSTSYGPFSLGGDPASRGFKVRDLNMHDGIARERFDQRRDILSTVDEHFRTLEKSDALTAMDSFYQSAYSLVSSASAREAFNLAAEPQKIRDEYGQHDAGQRMLMARRLVEAGVRFVSLTYGGWDMHQNVARNMERQLPHFDQAFAALITDLDRRGMLDKTLVMVSSEFGRTPKINKDAGRDHWPRVFSVAFAGGGFKRGYIHGASDPTGSEPDSDPLTVENMAATVFTQLGIKPDKKLMSPGGRPQAIVRDGTVVPELLA